MQKLFSQVSNKTAALALGTAVVLAISALAFSEKPADTPRPTVNIVLDERPIVREAAGGRSSFAPIVKRVAPCVVKVLTTTRLPVGSLFGGSPGMDDLLRRFFGIPDNGERPGGRVPVEQGIGSGVIVSTNGYILTNDHVVDGADEMKVGLQDGREFRAKLVGRDPQSDIAVIKIEATDLPAITMADSDKVEVGDVVLAVGNPFGIGQTVTTGIVSATGRGGPAGLDYEDFIQTDAAINPGNSGGALVDVEGRLIGINTAILSGSGGNQGIGFAIPSNIARAVMQGLIQDGRVIRGYLGVRIQTLTPALAREFGINELRGGALVAEVLPGSPASKGGIRTGDVVVEFNGRNIRDARHLKLATALAKPGRAVSVKVFRDGKSKTLRIEVGAPPGSEQKLAQNDSSGNRDTGTLNGVTVTDIDATARRQLHLPRDLRGVLVTDVDQDCAAADAGLQPGDVIEEINHKAVSSAEQAVGMTEKTTKKITLLRFWRDGASHFMVVDETGEH